MDFSETKPMRFDLVIILNMLPTHLQNGQNAIVIQGVKYILPFPAGFDKMHLL